MFCTISEDEKGTAGGGWGWPPAVSDQALIDFLETPYGAGEDHAGTPAW